MKEKGIQKLSLQILTLKNNKKTGIDKEIVTKILNSFAFKIRDQKNDGTRSGSGYKIINKNFIKAISDMDIQKLVIFLLICLKRGYFGYLSPSFQDCKNKRIS